jgi:transcriptional regulator with XRE-family HTH domain
MKTVYYLDPAPFAELVFLNGWSLAQLARNLGRSRAHLNMIALGHRALTGPTLAELRGALGAGVDDCIVRVHPDAPVPGPAHVTRLRVPSPHVRQLRLDSYQRRVMALGGDE